MSAPNPPAFPRSAPIAINYADLHRMPAAQEGMTLRDYFAGQALVGLVANPGPAPGPPERFAAVAYEYADAMLAARNGERARPEEEWNPAKHQEGGPRG